MVKNSKSANEKSNNNKNLEEIKDENANYIKKKKKNKYKKSQKLTTDIILQKLSFKFTRDAEWFKRTYEMVGKVKQDLDKKFYTADQKAGKIDFIRKLQNKLKDYKDAIQNEEKYRGIRFVERRKLERMLKKVNKEIENKSENIDEIKEIEIRKDKILENLNYVKHYPKSYKYYSLFPNKDKENPETLKKTEKMRKKINFYMNKKTKFNSNTEDSSDENNEEVLPIKKEKNTCLDINLVDNHNNINNDEILKQPTISKKSKKRIDTNDYEREASKGFNKYNTKNIKNDDFFIVEEDD